jgi:tRNA dimethylallyltransferase
VTGKLIAVVGPTASGKTALALELARSLHHAAFEIVNADSRQVYRHMDIGTAKPTAEELAQAPHHLVDIIDPDEPFSLGAWLDLAVAALEDITARGGVPVVVGGTGQYVWALLEGWRVPRVPPDPALRSRLATLPPEDLRAELEQVDPEAFTFVQPGNLRRIIRALEVYHATGKPFSHWRTRQPPSFEWTAIGLSWTRQDLYARIDARVDAMFEGAFVDEVRALRKRGYSCALPSMSSIGYREVCAYLDGEITLDDAIRQTKTGTHRLARHQASWFKPADERMHWVRTADEALTLCREFLRAG